MSKRGEYYEGNAYAEPADEYESPQGSSRRKQGTRTQRTRSLPCVAPDWSDPRESQRIISPSSPSSPNLNPFRHDPTSRPARASDEDLNPFLRDPTSMPARASGQLLAFPEPEGSVGSRS